MTPAETASAITRRGFVSRLERADRDALRAASLDSLMLNVTLRCDMACAHCHHSCSPSRTEDMSADTLRDALDLLRIIRPALLDITGGEPTLWPLLPELVESASETGVAIRVRTNLGALARPENAELPDLFARLGVSLLASLPGTSANAVAAQRGSSAFGASIEALRNLANFGYGAGEGLTLDLAYNPPLGERSASESTLTEEFRAALQPHGVRFDSLVAIANVPVGQFARRLKAVNRLDSYVAGLAADFNDGIAGAIACRSGLVVGWDGTLSDCDFNLAAGIGLTGGPATLRELLAGIRADAHAFALEAIRDREIAFATHCFACTAGAGSS